MNKPSRGRFEQVPLTSIPVLLEKTRHPQVLHVSSDPVLLGTRGAILERSGVLTVSAGSGAEAVRLCRRHSFDAVVLCHELAPRHKQEVIHAVRRRGSGTKVIGLYSVTPSEAAGADLAVDSHDGPEALLQAVRTIL
jgi:CheY-like chemotaxis protein